MALPIPDSSADLARPGSSEKGLHRQECLWYANRDLNFQGFGRFLTGSTGEYLFRTVKPGLYPGRTRHIHVKVKLQGQPDFVTQVYVEGEPQNDGDGILNGIRDPLARASVIVPFTPVEGSAIGELAARFDIVLGFTPPA